jgi:hypothetical protein
LDAFQTNPVAPPGIIESVLSVSLCHAAQDAQFAGELSNYLRNNLGFAPDPVTIGLGRGLVEAADLALAADVAILLLSSAAVPPQWVLNEWQPVLIDGPKQRGSELLTVLLEECNYPPLLNRRRFFDARAGRLACFRELKRDLLARLRPVRPETVLPAGVEPAPTADLEPLQAALADAPGLHSTPDLSAAAAFAIRSAKDFEFIVWLDCAERSAASIAGEFAAKLGAPPTAALRTVLQNRRGLIVLEDPAPEAEALFQPLERVSLLLVRARRNRPAPGRELAASLAAAIGDVLNGRTAEIDETMLYRSMRWAIEHRDPDLATSALSYFKLYNRAAEVLETIELLESYAVRTLDRKVADLCAWERIWIADQRAFVPALEAPRQPAPHEQLAFSW